MKASTATADTPLRQAWSSVDGQGPLRRDLIERGGSTPPPHRLDGAHKDTEHCALTDSLASTDAPRLIRRRVDLAPVRKFEKTYSSSRAPHYSSRRGLAWRLRGFVTNLHE